MKYLCEERQRAISAFRHSPSQPQEREVASQQVTSSGGGKGKRGQAAARLSESAAVTRCQRQRLIRGREMKCAVKEEYVTD